MKTKTYELSSRELLDKVRKYSNKKLNESNDSNPEEQYKSENADLDVEPEIKEKFKKAISPRIKFTKYVKEEDNTTICGKISLGPDNVILFNFDIVNGHCYITTKNLRLDGDAKTVIDKLNAYYDVWSNEINGETVNNMDSNSINNTPDMNSQPQI
jgi:hypothetical protein